MATDDLTLYDKNHIMSRIEKFLFAICSLDSSDLPIPLSRIEELYNCLVTGDTPPTFEPLSRAEKFLMACLGAYDINKLPKPLSRSEVLLKKIATGDSNLEDVDNLQSKYEFLLAYIIQNGGIDGDISYGDISYMKHTLTKKETTLYNTIEYPVKSAILKGNTRKNEVIKNEEKKVTITSSTTSNSTISYSITGLENDTAYWFSVDVVTNTCVGTSSTATSSIIYTADGEPFKSYTQLKNANGEGLLAGATGRYFAKVRTATNITNKKQVLFYLGRQIGAGTIIFKNPFICKSVTGEELPPYFEGMASVKMPVLTTTGKNLFKNLEWELGLINSAGVESDHTQYVRTKNYIDIKPNTTYTATGYMERFAFYDSDKNFISSILGSTSKSSTTFTTPLNAKYLKLGCFLSTIKTLEEMLNAENMLELGEQSSVKYEPYKSNILTTPEDLVLRGIGDIKDELNLMTGEVTQRIGEVILDGSDDENWTPFAELTDVVSFALPKTFVEFDVTGATYSLNDAGLPTYRTVFNQQDECLAFNYDDLKHLQVQLSKTKVTDLNSFKNYLKQHPIRIVAILATATTKTVVLSIVNQDGNDTKLSTFNDITHVTLSSEGLVPTGEIDIARPIQFVDYSLDNSWTPLYNTIEYPVKSAILKGNTLVNVGTYKTKDDFFACDGIIDNDSYITITATNGSYKNVFTKTNSMIKPSTKYLIVFDIVENTLDSPFAAITLNNNLPSDSVWTTDGGASIPIGAKGVYKFIRTTKSDLSESTIQTILRSYVSASATTGAYIKYRTMIIEYQEGMENWDIPYFTGMQSVKMPVLTTTWKQLLNVNDLSNIITTNGTIPTLPTIINAEKGIIQINETSRETFKGYKVKVKPNTDYIGSCLSLSGEYIRCRILDLQGNKLNNQTDYNSRINYSFNSGDNDYIVVAFTCHITNNEQVQIALYEGTTQPTTYEPYKSNILTVNEEVELRGVSEGSNRVEDELDCLTGEVVERVGEFVLDGSEDILQRNDIQLTDKIAFQINNVFGFNTPHAIPMICNNFNVYYKPDDKELIRPINGSDAIVINISTYKCNDLDSFKAWLSQNPVTVQYQLATESVKTVVLSIVNQDGNNTKLSTFDDITYVTLSSEGLIPKAELEVATKNVEVINTLSLEMDDISTAQTTLEETSNTQSENMDTTMIATTEIYEGLL